MVIRRRRKAIRHRNPRVACGSVSSRRNKYVGATFTKVRGAAKGTRRVIGCARVGSDSGYYATRKVGAKGTRYTPIKKRSLRDLKHAHKGSVKLVRHSGVKLTDAALMEAWAKRYAKPVKPRKKAKKARKVVANRTRKLYGAALASHRKAVARKAAKRSVRRTPARRGKLTGAAKQEFLARMAAGRRRAARR